MLMRSTVLVALVIGLAPGLAWSQPSRCNDRNSRESQQIFERVVSQRMLSSSPAEAAVLLDRAYDLCPFPDFLYNAGMAYEAAGNNSEAINRYQRYQLAMPNATVERRQQLVERVTRLLALVTNHGNVAVNTVDPHPPTVTVLTTTQPTTRVGTRRQEPHLITPTAPATHRLFPVWPVILYGVGAAALGFGIWSGFEAERNRSLVQNASIWTPDVDSAHQGASNAQTGMWVSLGIGAALVTTATIWLAAGHWTRTEQPRVTPLVGLGQVGLRAVF